jgi:hypothetical protein
MSIQAAPAPKTSLSIAPRQATHSADVARVGRAGVSVSDRKVAERWRTQLNTITGWWLTSPSEKYEFVSWDYCRSQYMEN